MNTEIIIALIAAFGSGLLVKIIDVLLTKRNLVFIEEDKIRAELRTEVEILRKRIIELEKERDDWREKYFDSRQVD